MREDVLEKARLIQETKTSYSHIYGTNSTSVLSEQQLLDTKIADYQDTNAYQDTTEILGNL